MRSSDHSSGHGNSRTGHFNFAYRCPAQPSVDLWPAATCMLAYILCIIEFLGRLNIYAQLAGRGRVIKMHFAAGFNCGSVPFKMHDMPQNFAVSCSLQINIFCELSPSDFSNHFEFTDTPSFVCFRHVYMGYCHALCPPLFAAVFVNSWFRKTLHFPLFPSWWRTENWFRWWCDVWYDVFVPPLCLPTNFARLRFLASKYAFKQIFLLVECIAFFFCSSNFF